MIIRYTFGWVRTLLDHSRAQQRLEYDDLPALDHHTRSEDTLNRFSSTSSAKSGALWYLIYADHRARFITQWILTVIESVAYHGPSIFLFKILKNLEDPDREPNNPDAWLLVAGLGFALLFHLVIDTWYACPASLNSTDNEPNLLFIGSIGSVLHTYPFLFEINFRR